MLTAYQIERTAYFTGGDVICRDDVLKEIERDHGEKIVEALVESDWAEDDATIEKLTGYQPLDRYSVEESFGEEGLFCADCGVELVAPPTPHDRLEWGLETLAEHLEYEHGTAPDRAEGRGDLVVPPHDLFDHDHEWGAIIGEDS